MIIMSWALNFITVILFEDVISRFHFFNVTDIGQLEGYRQMEVPELFEGSGCVDTRPWCEYIDIEVDCKAGYIQKNCQKSCNLCSDAECPEFCAEIYAPVCGTDGNTYDNECELKVQACYTHNNDLKVKHDGKCKVPTCIDGIKNQGEAGIDCGGPCRPCASCNDGIHNQDEDKIDCGGPCKACPTCNDGIQNQNEAAIDCGGPCRACPTCNDQIQNQGETGIDCGGPCVKACKLCCFNGRLEQHPYNPWHGDVCRNWDLSFTVCPLGCQKSTEPYCLRNGSPCRIKAGKECTLSICPRSHPYLDLDGRAANFHGEHGDVCRNRWTKFACPKGCRYHAYHYCVDEKFNYPCRT